MESTRFVVLADDLTSAAEAAGHLADTGRRASVLLDVGRETSTGLDAGDGWLCLDLDSRRLPEGEAAARHERAMKWLGEPGLGVYKTMDSSLRGNWAAELAAVMEAAGRRLAVVAPACPAYDRKTVNGHQWADGVPVHRGPAGNDPVRPVTASSVLEPLAQKGIPTTLVTPDGVTEALEGRGAVVVDATTEDDLALVAKAVEGHLKEIVLCGSPGMWEALHPKGSARRELPTARKVLVLVGSLHPTTREQLAELANGGVPVLTAPEPQQVVEALKTLTTVAVATPEVPTTERHLRTLAAIGVHCAKAVPGTGFVLSGGDTARELAMALRSTGIRAAGTVASGIMVGTLIGPGHPVITKAGGFGGPDMLIAAAHALTRGTR